MRPCRAARLLTYTFYHHKEIKRLGPKGVIINLLLTSRQRFMQVIVLRHRQYTTIDKGMQIESNMRKQEESYILATSLDKTTLKEYYWNTLKNTNRMMHLIMEWTGYEYENAMVELWTVKDGDDLFSLILQRMARERQRRNKLTSRELYIGPMF